jgi:LuxR family transcriptional regulator, maltose regulon positive regulatory protein
MTPAKASLRDRQGSSAVEPLGAPASGPDGRGHARAATSLRLLDDRGTVSGSRRAPRFPASKFSIPTVPAQFVHRPRLFHQLDQGEYRRLTLVVGSAGSGKTVLLADWLASRPARRSAWLACDAADADPVRFAAAIIECCRRACDQPDLGEDAQQLLGLDGEVTADVAAALADDLQQHAGPLVLVVDDVHLADIGGVDALALLLEYRPPGLQLVLATRADPRLRVHRMRANQEVAEMRDRDLAFSAEESEELLSGFGVELSERDLAAVYRQTEGWAAGLQMAAISIHDSADRVVAARRVELRGRTVAGYFLDEVLYRQPPEVVDFMLVTSVLDELSAASCRALCGPTAGALLSRVYGSNLFLVLVDDDAPTYRYHHLIRDVLLAELHARDPSREKLLHAAAADYLADTGQIRSAARHLLAAGHTEAAFSLLSDRVLHDFLARPTIGSALDIEEVQPDLFAGAPEVLVPLATELVLGGGLERANRALMLAEKAGIDAERQPDLAFRQGHVKSLYCLLVGQLEESLALREQVLEMASRLSGVDDWLANLDYLAYTCYAYMGQFSEANRLAGPANLAPFGDIATAVLYPGTLSLTALDAGDLEQAEKLAERVLTAARRLRVERHWVAVEAMRTSALLALEKCDLTTAEIWTESVLALVEGGGRPIHEYLAQLDRARIWATSGDLDAALASLPAARAALRSDHSPLFARADELEARLRLVLGDRRGAEDVAGRLPDDRRLVVLAIIALAAGNRGEAIEAVERLPAPTIRADLEIRLLRASVAVATGSPTAGQTVKHALRLAEKHGFVQTVLDTPRVVEHLITHSDRYAPSDYLGTLISAYLEARKQKVGLPHTGGLPDPLTHAELRVLEKLPLRLSYSELAADLNLSLNTVKTHMRHTYMKLGVTSRSAAVQRATTLGLI